MTSTTSCMQLHKILETNQSINQSSVDSNKMVIGSTSAVATNDSQQNNETASKSLHGNPLLLTPDLFLQNSLPKVFESPDKLM